MMQHANDDNARKVAVRNMLIRMQQQSGLEPVKELFWTTLNYERINEALSRQGWSTTTYDFLAENPILLAGGGVENQFHVIYCRLTADSLSLTAERQIVSKLFNDHPYALFIFSDRSQRQWHFLNVRYDKKQEKRRLYRRITIGRFERLHTATQRIALLDLDISPEVSSASPLEIQYRHDAAFNVEQVTKEFFGAYSRIFKAFETDLRGQTGNQEWAHDYALQFLNRCMFLYFIQRKRWLGEDAEFLRTFWKHYRIAGRPADTFFPEWLSVLFFEAFNNHYTNSHPYLPQAINDVLALAPWLNGGLFARNVLDDETGFTVTDERFEEILDFLDQYNFTITEDSPLDQEVAVDPEMIGKVYESLVNVTPETDERSEAGIFYTPRTEIDLMCRLTLVDYLTNHLGAQHRYALYEFVFALEPDEKTNADNYLAAMSLWPAIDEHLRAVTAVDPACGSGSFLVGMLQILDDLQARAAAQLGTVETAYDRRKRIIGQSLYGVDVKDWACHVAELRLWLSLVVDAEFNATELHVRQEPLLPNFTFKIRPGDSLVQEIGGINMRHLHSGVLTISLRKRIAELKNEKRKFYESDPTCKYPTASAVNQEERLLFRAILDERRNTIEEEIKSLQRRIDNAPDQQGFAGITSQPPRQMRLDTASLEKQIQERQSDLGLVRQAIAGLAPSHPIPFVWDIAFVEIFSETEPGFDIVIGNPPYVDSESIKDPGELSEQVTTESKKAYKAKLARSVYQAFPGFFAYNWRTNTAGRKLNGKSDLYVYFYFHGLSLLNRHGAFCFITSNSWLDVGYGADLQEFLLKHCHVHMILDNETRRSFEAADVNTVMALFTAADERQTASLDQTARFVMVTAPFDHILSAVVFEEIEGAVERRKTPEYRVFPIVQQALLKDGCLMSVVDDVTSVSGLLAAQYTGNKWGGKYLRAPDIYWTVLQKGLNFSRPLSHYFDGERYLNTGGADGFFILTNVAKLDGDLYRIINDRVMLSGNKSFSGEIEAEYMVPLIKDFTKTHKSIEVAGFDAFCSL